MTRTQILQVSVHHLPFELIPSLQPPEYTHEHTHTSNLLTTAQLITLQLTVLDPIKAHSVTRAALSRLLIIDPCVAPPEVN